MTFERIGSLSTGLCDAEDYQPTVLLCSARFQHWPHDFYRFLTGTSKSYRKIWSLSILEVECIFDHALVILGRLWGPARADVEWLIEHWAWPAVKRPDGWQMQRKHIPPPHDADMRDMLHCVGPERRRPSSVKLYHQCEQRSMSLLGPLHATFVLLLVYLKMLWGFHWTCSSLFVPVLPFFVFVFLFLSVHATLKWMGRATVLSAHYDNNQL